MTFIKLTPVQDQGTDTPEYCIVNADCIAVVSPLPDGGSSILFQNDMSEALLITEEPEVIMSYL